MPRPQERPRSSSSTRATTRLAKVSSSAPSRRAPSAFLSSAPASPTVRRSASQGRPAYVKVLPNETRTSYNVLAESRSGNANNVVMVGAHLDSVDAGPGINDNGSGVAAILETARQMAKVNPRNQVRFAFWGAEELGLVGSTEYVLTDCPTTSAPRSRCTSTST